MKACVDIPAKDMVYSNGSQTVRIYTVNTQKSGTLYQLSYYYSGQRKRKTFSSLSEAKRCAKHLLGQLVDSAYSAESITPAQIQTYHQARLKAEGMGMNVLEATERLERAQQVIGNSDLFEACAFYAKHHNHLRANLSPEQMVQAFIDSRKERELSREYINQARYLLQHFAREFKQALPATDVIQKWIANRSSNLTSRNVMVRLLKAMGHWATKNKVLAINVFAELELYKVKGAAVSIYTPEEMRTILSKTNQSMISFVALGAFAGLRTAEIARLEWKDINLHRGWITVAAEKSKTAARRMVPIADNLKSWLEAHIQTEGRVLPYELTYAMKFLRQEGMPRKKNALRHSYISYRLAQIHDAPRVALEAGNSPAIIFKHYRELVAPEDAQEWFSITP